MMLVVFVSRSEMALVLLLVAIVVVWPKDLPHDAHVFGRFTGKMRAVSPFEFTQSIDELGRQA